MTLDAQQLSIATVATLIISTACHTFLPEWHAAPMYTACLNSGVAGQRFGPMRRLTPSPLVLIAVYGHFLLVFRSAAGATAAFSAAPPSLNDVGFVNVIARKASDDLWVRFILETTIET